MGNLYETLFLDRTATSEQIRQAYRKLVQKEHPDKGGSAESFKTIKEAYEVLIDTERRKFYDQTGLLFPEQEEDSAWLKILGNFIVSAMDGLDVREHNIPAKILEQIEINLEKCEDSNADFLEAIGTRKLALERFTHNGEGENFIINMIMSDISRLESAQARLKKQQADFEKVKEVVQRYGYKVDIHIDETYIDNLLNNDTRKHLYGDFK